MPRRSQRRRTIYSFDSEHNLPLTSLPRKIQDRVLSPPRKMTTEQHIKWLIKKHNAALYKQLVDDIKRHNRSIARQNN